jgi:hypothetical protein
MGNNNRGHLICPVSASHWDKRQPHVSGSGDVNVRNRDGSDNHSLSVLSHCPLGVMDVAMNASAVVAELVAEIPLMGSFHGSYSVAAAIGSLFGSILSSSGWSVF